MHARTNTPAVPRLHRQSPGTRGRDRDSAGSRHQEPTIKSKKKRNKRDAHIKSKPTQQQRTSKFKKPKKRIVSLRYRCKPKQISSIAPPEPKQISSAAPPESSIHRVGRVIAGWQGVGPSARGQFLGAQQVEMQYRYLHHRRSLFRSLALSPPSLSPLFPLTLPPLPSCIYC